MEVGIRKGRGEGPEGTLLIYDHWGEYTLSKKPGGWYTTYTRQYTTEWHCSHSMPSRVYESVLRLSVCPICWPLQERAVGLLLWAQPAGRRHQSTVAPCVLGRCGCVDPCPQQHATQQQTRAVSRCQLTYEAEQGLVKILQLVQNCCETQTVCKTTLVQWRIQQLVVGGQYLFSHTFCLVPFLPWSNSPVKPS